MKIEHGGKEYPEVPRDLQAKITKAGGSNLYGEPNFRIVFGASRTEILGGDWPGIGVCYKRVPRYGPRWVLEIWVPPLRYGSPEEWEELTVKQYGGVRIATMGAFPSRGDYEHLVTLEQDGEFVQLTPHVVESAITLVHASRKLVGGSRDHKLDKAAKLETDWDSEADDMIRDVQPAFDAKPWVSQSYRGKGSISPH